MEEQEIFTMFDEVGNEREARILNIVEVNEQEYVVYAISQNEEEEAIYAAKLVKDMMGNEDIVSIDNEEEKKVVFEAIREIIDNLD